MGSCKTLMGGFLDDYIRQFVCHGLVYLKVDKPITTLICNLAMLGTIARRANIFHRCVLVI